MVQLIAFIIFIVSTLGALWILNRRMPEVAQMPQNGGSGLRSHRWIAAAEEKARELAESFDKNVWMHRVLSWVKVLILKVEVQIDHLLHGVRKKAQKKTRAKKRSTDKPV